MKIAIPYENGSVFQHFGKTEAFIVYEMKDGQLESGKVIHTNGTGHEALADFLSGLGVNILICGGIGQGAMQALEQARIAVCSGAQGNVNAVLEAYLNGTLKSAGTNCDHHDKEAGHSCGGSCGSCAGCHGGSTMTGRNVGKTCRAHYTGTFNDGTEFDSSYKRGEPLEFVCGMGMMIPGFDAAVADMAVGETRDVHLSQEEAYGPSDPNLVVSFAITDLTGAENLKVGDRVNLCDDMGRPVPAAVVGRDKTTITFDANHEMAGKELNFHIELVASF